ncbi:MAG: epoxide hydrolase [Sphingobacteriaceae bacterium]|nr:epoxide hydrolase [Cytophagaceae bacterium]
MGMRPFQINIAQETLDDLRERLARTRWPDEVEGVGWQYGTNLSYLKELVAYWQSGFDWRAQEAALNRFAQFRTEIDGFGLHFIHERGRGERPLPLLLSHGWPDSFYRFYKIIPMLTDPEAHGGRAEDAFDVVVPSLPGYGFSDRPTEKGFGQEKTAVLLTRLMTEMLGYKRFAAHGGDVGSGITERLATAHADSLVGIHLLDVPYWHLFATPPDDLSEAEQKYLETGQQWSMTEGAYAMMQSTKPQTAAFGLNDSPAGLAAWLVEKFQSWSDCGGNIETRFTKDELLTNLTIYWATETIRSSFAPYYEQEENPPENSWKPLNVPTGIAIFPKDIVPAPRAYAERLYNVQRWTEMPRGGHFAALEEPELFVEELRAFFRPLRKLTF